MGKKKKLKKDESSIPQIPKDKKEKGLKTECCEKYIKKGEQKRCRRCPCFDMNELDRQKRFEDLEIDSYSKD